MRRTKKELYAACDLGLRYILEDEIYHREKEPLMKTETAWVLEKGQASQPRYATVSGGMLDWTEPGDHAKALRLARRQDADALAEIMEDADRVAEHAWG